MPEAPVVPDIARPDALPYGERPYAARDPAGAAADAGTEHIVIRLATVVALAAVVASCDRAGRGEPGAVAVRDSAGVRITDNRGPEQDASVGSPGAAPFLVIGRVEGAGPDVFSQVRHAVRLRSGAIAVADGHTRELRLFDGDGRHSRSIGRSGEGPGEFAVLWHFAELPGDSIGVVDPLNARVSIFTSEGDFARSHPLPRISAGGAPNVVGWLEDGTLVVSTQHRPPEAGALTETWVVVYLVDRDGRVGGQIGRFPDRRLGRNGLGLGFGAGAVLAVFGTTIWYGHGSRFDLRAFDGDGTLRRIVRLDRAGRPVTELDVAEARRVVEQDLVRQGASGPAVQRILATEYADTHPVHGTLLVDLEGNLWVEQYRSHLLAHPEPAVWDVFDPGGRYAGTVEAPPDVRVTQVGGGVMVGIHTDELGVERVHLYRLSMR